EAVVADWMLEFACYGLCRHFGEGCAAEFWRWRDVAQALINGFSKIPTHQKKMVYLCQLLIRIAKGKNLGDLFLSKLVGSCLSQFKIVSKAANLKKMRSIERSVLKTLVSQPLKFHMENGYFKEAAEVLQRLFTDSDSDKPLRVKLATVIKSKDPYVPLLQSFSYNLLISKIKSYIEPFMKGNETNFLIQAATKEVESKGLGATALQNKTVNEKDKRNLETKQSLSKHIHSRLVNSRMQNCCLSVDFSLVWICINCLLGLSSLQNVEKPGDALACGRRRQRWTRKEDLELKSGIREFGVGNWAKILVHGDFNNRTSVMLKDRWRTL
ncbi:TERF1 factor, partial [Sagittarius serpentarius]|nr:TERF1 factor [Sagittarius serpentarius]